MRSILRNVRRSLQASRVDKSNIDPRLAMAMRCLALDQFPPEIDAIAERAEGERKRLLDMGDTPVSVLYSPKPGSAKGDRPQHGEMLELSMERAAVIGKDRRWASGLALFAKGRKTALELGSCVGISGAYIAQVVDKLYTVEGSPSLAAAAEEVIGNVSPNAVVINALFHDALDEMLGKIEPIDFLFIDGHHEKVATIQYWERCRPFLSENALVIFDDISWSQDMRDCWDEVRYQNWFADCVDLGSIGVCIHSEGSTPKQWDFRSVVHRPFIGNPWGWND